MVIDISMAYKFQTELLLLEIDKKIVWKVTWKVASGWIDMIGEQKLDKNEPFW